MPRGTVHDVTGVLSLSKLGLVVEMPEGGFWIVEAPWRRTSHLIGKMVRVIGVREGFNLLVVKTMVATKP